MIVVYVNRMKLIPQPLIIAHRGASAEAPENTLAAFRRAWHEGADGIECDLRLSADNRIMVHHDPTAHRTTGQALTIAQSSSDNLRTLDAGRLKSPQYAGEHIPFFEEVLDTVPPGGRLFIELKTGGDLPSLVRETLPEHAQSFCTLIGFDPEILVAVRRQFPDNPVLWLLEHGTSTPLKTAAQVCAIIDRARGEGFDGLDIRHTDITAPLADMVHNSGLSLWAWTVNNATSVRRLTGLGVAGLTTDRPGWLRSVLELTRGK